MAATAPRSAVPLAGDVVAAARSARLGRNDRGLEIHDSRTDPPARADARARCSAGEPPREPLEVRRAVIEALLAQVQPGRPRPQGAAVQPAPRSTSWPPTPPSDACSRRRSSPDGSTRDLRRELERAGAQCPRGFARAAAVRARAGQELAPGARFHVTVSQSRRAAPGGRARERQPVGRRPRGGLGGPARASTARPRPRTLTSEAVRINIGRQVDVVDQRAGRCGTTTSPSSATTR